MSVLYNNKKFMKHFSQKVLDKKEVKNSYISDKPLISKIMEKIKQDRKER